MKPELSETELTELEIRVLSHLEVGHNNTISLRNLTLRSGTSERKVRLAIESLRHQGYLIIFWPTIPQGYCIAETQEEVDIFKDYMLHRIKNECWILRDIRVAAKRKFSREFGQMKLFEN